MNWIIEEATSYRAAVYDCGDQIVVANGTLPIRFGLKREPRGFFQTGVLDSTGKEIWIARTKLDLNGPEIIMSYTVRYVIDVEQRIVILLHVEHTLPEEMTWNDDDPLPF
ncbi:hypothetical protein [Paracoccus tegillarcae]|uniref:Uncharacterized protein n=1 Tax=Paracoccus tegillarcae TaxID=1529068 RepID=A0A2K9EPS7_9RHOB|nr:hypothetical protein [Paracoccus tegillarcae]AUH32726.1 hypothetical protein CUV01_04425 [Paracoccus tegillarcae]